MDHPIHFMFGSKVGSWGQRIEWRYFWYDKTHYGDGHDMTENNQVMSPFAILLWSFFVLT